MSSHSLKNVVELLSNSKDDGVDAVCKISEKKKEPEWMKDIRLRALDIFHKKEMPKWLPHIKGLDKELDKFIYYYKPFEKQAADWNKVPDDIKKQFDELGIPESERKYLAGSAAQIESEVVYHNLKKQWEEKGVIFKGMDDGLRDHPEIVKEYFGKVVPAADNKFSALNTAFWSGGSFVYVPKDVTIDVPLQIYFKINTENMGQFERTLIIGEERSNFHYVEGCSAPMYSSASLHTAVVEVFAKAYSHVRYTTIQNWSKNIYNLVTKRAIAYRHAYVEWVDGNIGSKVTAKYPSIILREPFAKGYVLSIAYAKKGQVQDSGAKMIHLAPHTTSQIVSKGVCTGGGKQIFRGLIKVVNGAKKTKSNMVCDTLLLDDASYSDAHPDLQVDENDVKVSHEASIGKIGEDELFYLMSRGLTAEEAISTIVMGFVEPFTKELPLEYAVELNRLIELDVEGESQHVRNK